MILCITICITHWNGKVVLIRFSSLSVPPKFSQNDYIPLNTSMHDFNGWRGSYYTSVMMTPSVSDVTMSPLFHEGCQGSEAPPHTREPCLHADSYKDMCQLADLSNDDSIPFWCHYIPPYLMVARDMMPRPLHVTLVNHVFMLTATKICASWQISAKMTPFLSDVITFPPISWWPGMWCPAPYMLLFWTMSSYWQLYRYVPVGRSQHWWLHSFLMPLHSPLSPSGHQGSEALSPTCYSSEPCLHTDS